MKSGKLVIMPYLRTLVVKNADNADRDKFGAGPTQGSPPECKHERYTLFIAKFQYVVEGIIQTA